MGNPLRHSDPTGLFVIAAPVIAAAVEGIINTAAGLYVIYLGQKSINNSKSPSKGDPPSTLQQEIEKGANYSQYKNRCSEKPPTGMTDPCEIAKWKLQRALDCKALRQANTDKWWGGNDFQHDPQLSEDLERAIRNAQQAVKNACKKECP